MKISAQAILDLHPCWTEGDVRAAVGRGKTPTQIAKAEHVPAPDRRWVLTRLAAGTKKGRMALALWAAGCAQDVRDLITDEDTRDTADTCVAAVAAFFVGCATEQDCRDAAAAAYAYAYAAYYAASAAYATAASDAASASASAAAYYATAASDAASASASAAAYYATAAASDAAHYASAAAAGRKVERKHLLELAAVVEATWGAE